MAAKKLGLYFTAVVCESNLETAPEHHLPAIDGYLVAVGMDRFPGERNVEVRIRQGMSPRDAAALLRRFAYEVEDKTKQLVNLPDQFKGGGMLRQDGTIEWWEDDSPNIVDSFPIPD